MWLNASNPITHGLCVPQPMNPGQQRCPETDWTQMVTDSGHYEPREAFMVFKYRSSQGVWENESPGDPRGEHPTWAEPNWTLSTSSPSSPPTEQGPTACKAQPPPSAQQIHTHRMPKSGQESRTTEEQNPAHPQWPSLDPTYQPKESLFRQEVGNRLRFYLVELNCVFPRGLWQVVKPVFWIIFEASNPKIIWIFPLETKNVSFKISLKVTNAISKQFYDF